MSGKIKVLVDTDIGDDIDDALALALLINMPEIELIGVTTVFKNTKLRAAMARKLLKLAGIHVPVFAGAGNPLVRTVNTSEVFCQATEDLEEYVTEEDNSEGDAAIQFILESAEKYGEELVVAAIGPLTNIALVIKKNPEAMSRINKLVVMGGAFFELYREYNIESDAEAAKVVFEAGLPLHCVSADVTFQTQLDENQTKAILNKKDTPYTAFLAKSTEAWMNCTHFRPYLHDPLTLYYIAHPEIVEMEEVLVEVETEGRLGRGVTFNLDNCYKWMPNRLEGKRALCSRSVKAKMFIDLFMKTYLREGDER